MKCFKITCVSGKSTHADEVKGSGVTFENGVCCIWNDTKIAKAYAPGVWLHVEEK